MEESADENRRIIMEVLYRHRASGGGTVNLEDVRSLDLIDAGRLRDDIEYLEALDYVELLDGRVGLTELGFMLMENREFSFCPHL
ncbi:MAG TPA: hypothetical protein VMW03_03470 [Candidatus Krumholzibacteriaceae bacterium]|nr:hypothetical protein [Candidatus Krumholzibacteriaceae bacterium]